MTSKLSVVRGAALYVGALLGPGLLLLPGLAARIAGPASFVAWVLLLGVSGLIGLIFGQLGLRFPSVGGVRAYTAAGLGRFAGRAVGWCFLAGVITGAPIVCLIGGDYVALLLGGAPGTSLVFAMALLVAVLAVTARGLRTSALVQVALVAVLLALVATAVLAPLGQFRAANWQPFDPHGWAAVGSACSTLMLSFVGWEAVAGLTSRFSRPARQVPIVIAIAFATTSLIYLALAAVTIGVLGDQAATDVPLALLLEAAIGPTGRVLAAVAAVVLALGTTNAYLNGAAELARTVDSAARTRFPRWLAAAIMVSGMVMMIGVGVGVFSVEDVVTIPTAFFLTVYLGSTIAAVRLLRGGTRVAACVATVAVSAVLVLCGLVLVAPLAVGLVAIATSAGSRADIADNPDPPESTVGDLARLTPPAASRPAPRSS